MIMIMIEADALTTRPPRGWGGGGGGGGRGALNHLAIVSLCKGEGVRG